MRSYLFMFIMWSGLAALSFCQQWLLPGTARWTILGSDWSIGWIILLIALWNAFRWWQTWPEVQSHEENSDKEIRG
jgi:hypothetical protein